MAPLAHKETLFSKNGFARTDPKKREYMIKLSNILREDHGWFKGIKYLGIKLVLVFERPTKVQPEGPMKREWKDQELELMKCSSPDLDNCEKSIQDCLSNHRIQKEIRSKRTWNVLQKEVLGSGIIDDDRYICEKISYKVYAAQGEKGRIEITLWERSGRFVRDNQTKPIHEPKIYSTRLHSKYRINTNPKDEPSMRVTEAHVLYKPSTFKGEEEKPYVIYIPDYGALGDKFNCDTSRSGMAFPKKASSRFKFRKNAIRVCAQFVLYARQKIKDAEAASKKSSGKSRRPSYYLWR